MWRWEFSVGQSLRLWEEQQKPHNQNKQHVHMELVPSLQKESVPSLQKMTTESCGRILGEKPLERSYKDSNPFIASADAIQFHFNLLDTFTKPASLNDTPELVKPFKADPAKQERFEQFLKEKYQGGFRSTEFGGNSKMSESARACERLDFEAAAEAIEKGKQDSSNVLFPNQ
ncbi:hypothetical protein IFM89_032821 [Coptis chinensis]|uniref:Uncharacterized protein n=1 Tax=Coptis chinensis TaxID=261450 RepID=A0A835HP25_9MAGN|nr:hypothetical protein IFM89_032821 [Coptis chinensis]